jgi:hypothetical protein
LQRNQTQDKRSFEGLKILIPNTLRTVTLHHHHNKNEQAELEWSIGQEYIYEYVDGVTLRIAGQAHTKAASVGEYRIKMLEPIEPLQQKDRYLPDAISDLAELLSNSLDVVALRSLVIAGSGGRTQSLPWKYASTIANPASPPILGLLRPFQDGDNLALFEAEIAFLIRVKCEKCDSLIFTQVGGSSGPLTKDRLGRSGTTGPGPVVKEIVVVVEPSASLGDAVEGL